MVAREWASVTRHNSTKAEGREHGHVRVRTVLAEHSGTKVERHAIEHDARRTNDRNATGDRPKRETSGDLERQTLNRGGTLPANSRTTPEPSPPGGTR